MVSSLYSLVTAPGERVVTDTEKVAFLRRPTAYSDRPPWVKPIETHVSWVFLSELFAHKLKKPVRFDFIDLRSLESRLRDCDTEFRLNRRLAPDVYIAVTPLVVTPGGDLAIDCPGEVVDWLVRMRRLPSDRMLDQVAMSGAAAGDELKGIVRLLVRFFRNAIRVAVPPAEYRRRLAEQITTNRQTLLRPDFRMPTRSVERVSDALRRTLMSNMPMFEHRVRRGRVLEGHGDLRPEHVYLGPNPAVIDCLTCSRDLRILDWADELAFLAMECEMLGSPETGGDILDACLAALDDRPPPALIRFYKAHRALLRARLSVMHLDDAQIDDPSYWRARAAAYLHLAERHAGHLG